MQLLIGHGQVPTIMPEASYFPDKSHLPLCSLSVKPKTEQSRDKPLFYAILGVCIYMTIFKGCHTDTLAVMS